jgi:DNA-binding transcriptional MerR regulator
LTRARLKMILRGKRFGCSLDEIAEMLGLEEANMDEIQQIGQSRRFVDKKVDELRLRRAEMDFLEKDLLSFKKKLARESGSSKAKRARERCRGSASEMRLPFPSGPAETL